MASARHPWRTLVSQCRAGRPVRPGCRRAAPSLTTSPPRAARAPGRWTSSRELPEAARNGPCRPRGRGRHDHRRGPAGRRRGPRRGRHPRPTSRRSPTPTGPGRLRGRPHRVRRAHPRRPRARHGQAGVHRAVRTPSRHRGHRPRVELGGDAVFLNSEDETSGHVGIGCWSRCWCSWWSSAPPWPPSSPSACRSSPSVPASAPSPSCRLDDRLGLRDPRRRPGRPGRRCRLRTSSWSPPPREPRPAGHDNGRRWPTPRAPRVLLSSSPGAPSVATTALAITGVGVLTSIGLATALIGVVRGRRRHHPCCPRC